MGNISIIVASSINHVIGINNQLPWHLPADLQYFKKLTTGHTILMGRKTFESIGKPLPNRNNVVISRNPAFKSEGVIVYNNIHTALRACDINSDVFIIGGDQIYRQSLQLANTVYRTKVHTYIDHGDAFFPDLLPTEWILQHSDFHAADEKNKFDYTFETYTRKSSTS